MHNSQAKLLIITVIHMQAKETPTTASQELDSTENKYPNTP